MGLRVTAALATMRDPRGVRRHAAPRDAVICSASVVATADDGARMSATAINRYCPRSGKPVQSDSLTDYRGLVVGFCNARCRDDFAAHRSQRPLDTRYFDALIHEHDLVASDPAAG